MDFPTQQLTPTLTLFSFLLYGMLLGYSLWKANLRKILEADNSNVFLGACVLLMTLWTVRAGVAPGQNFHLLGATTLTLLFGWQFGFIAISLVIFGSSLFWGYSLNGFAWNAIFQGALPIAVSWWFLLLARRYLPKHFFIYVFVNAFFAAGISSFLSNYSSGLFLVVIGSQTFDWFEYNHAPFALLLMFLEAFVNGMVMTLLVVYKPGWVYSFHDRDYLNR